MIPCYPLAPFELLGAWLRRATQTEVATAGRQLLELARQIEPELGRFLEEAGFPGTWDRLRRTHRSRPALERAFHGWFDALKTLRLVRRLATGGRAPGPPEQTLPPLLSRAGLEPASEPGRQLELLRRLQNSSSFGRQPGGSLVQPGSGL